MTPDASAVWVLGTGRVALDLGQHALAHGHAVRFVGPSEERLVAVLRRARRAARRHGITTERCSVATLPLPPPPVTPAEMPGVVVEATVEHAAVKRARIAAVAGHLAPDALLFSASSSLLPSDLHPRCLGLHPMTPLSLTGFAELVVPTVARPDAARRARELCRCWGLRIVEQDERRAFLANRLLLPVQAEAAAWVVAGADAAAVDRAAAAGVLPGGPLSLMDAVGLDLVAAAVRSYDSRLPPANRGMYAGLAQHLETLVESGRPGRRSRAGWLGSGPLPWPAHADRPAPRPAHFAALLAETCRHAAERHLAPPEDLALALEHGLGLCAPLPAARAWPTAARVGPSYPDARWI